MLCVPRPCSTSIAGAVAGLLPASGEGGHRLHVLAATPSSRAVSGCDESEQRQLPPVRRENPVPEFREWQPWKGQYREPSMQAEPIRAKPSWRRVEDPVSHCLDGESLLLTGFPGTGKTHLAKQIVEALREHGDTLHIITKTHAAVQNVGFEAQMADHWNVRNEELS